MAATPAIELVLTTKTPHVLHEYAHDPSRTAYGTEAAEALDIPAGRVFKTLIVEAGDALCVAVVPVAGELDLKALAQVRGVKRAAMADARAAERATGYVVGGISPLGQRRRLPTIVDSSATRWPTVFVSGGRRGLEIELAAEDLVRLAGGTFAPIGRA